MATRVTITKALEAKLRKAAEETPEGYTSALKELVEKLDEEQGKRAAAQSGKDSGSPGLSYKELVALFRSYLGSALLTPPKPSVSFIVRIVNKAKEQGLDSTNVEQILRGLRNVNPRGPYRIADIIYNLDRYFSLGESREGLQVYLRDAEDKDAQGESMGLGGGGLRGGPSAVYTGRGDPEGDPEDNDS